MRLLEWEAKDIFRSYGIPVPEGRVITDPKKAEEICSALEGDVVLKAQVDVGGRGKEGGVLFADPLSVADTAETLFHRTIKGVPVERVLIEERLEILHEYYLSITIDRSSREILLLFSSEGGVDIETLASERPDEIRRIAIPPILSEVPAFAIRELARGAPREIGSIVSRLYRLFREKDAVLAEINPLVLTPRGLCAADAKLIVDDNALQRQGISVNRSLTRREQEAERHGFSYVELEGDIGVIGNGAGLTMATLDLIAQAGGRAANFLDVGGGAERERVMHAVRLVAGMPSVRVILVNLLGGITRCDEVAHGILDANVPQKIFVRLAGTNEEEGRRILAEKGYRMFDTMEQAVYAAVGVR
ncbi:MAG: ADP-forming succinate--CoA ligase subunit beta [Methanomicrobiales archaeon]|nr:ADP-forming succinate--CoA ligase subunit beta [Methanomicrobiales archaeon]